MEIYFFCKGIGLSSCGELFYLSPAQPSQTSYCHPLYEMHQGREEPSPAPRWLLWAEEGVERIYRASGSAHPQDGPHPNSTAFTRSDLHQDPAFIGPCFTVVGLAHS